jgi:hypothetical protein
MTDRPTAAYQHARARQMLATASRMYADAAQMRREAQIQQQSLCAQLEQLSLYRPYLKQLLMIMTDRYFDSENERRSVLCKALEAAIEITEADLGNLQLLDPATGALRIVAQHGFKRDFVEFFDQVHKGEAACGTALQNAQRIVVENVVRSPIFIGSSSLEVMLDAGAHAVQSTPIVDWSGTVSGVLSTHYRTPHRPPERNLRFLDLLLNRLVARLQPVSRD